LWRRVRIYICVYICVYINLTPTISICIYLSIYSFIYIYIYTRSSPSWSRRRRWRRVCIHVNPFYISVYIYLYIHLYLSIYTYIRGARQAAAGGGGGGGCVPHVLTLTLAFTNYFFTSRLLCTNQHYMSAPPPAPVLSTRLQYHCNTISQYSTRLRSPVCTPYTIQYWHRNIV